MRILNWVGIRRSPDNSLQTAIHLPLVLPRPLSNRLSHFPFLLRSEERHEPLIGRLIHGCRDFFADSIALLGEVISLPESQGSERFLDLTQQKWGIEIISLVGSME